MSKLFSSMVKWTNNLFSRPRIRLIETVGCAAYDGATEEGTIRGIINRNVFDGTLDGVDVDFYRVKLADGTIKEVPVKDCYPGSDNVLEYRT